MNATNILYLNYSLMCCIYRSLVKDLWAKFYMFCSDIFCQRLLLNFTCPYNHCKPLR